MKQFTLAICAAAILLFSCNNDAEKTAEATTDTTKTTEQPVAKETPAPMPDSATMMKNWEAYMTPGDVHKMMASWDGTWDVESTSWMAPGAPPMVSKGSSVNKMAMGGRYQISNHKGMMMGMPFEGMSMTGYDNAKKLFVSTWIDNMGTGIMKMEGPWDAATKSMTLTGKCVDPMAGGGKEMALKEIFKMVDDKTQVMEMYGPDHDGKEFKMMELKFTKK